MSEMTYSEVYRINRAREHEFSEMAQHVFADQARRTAVSAAIGKASMWLLFRLPDRAIGAIQGDDHWHPRFNAMLGAVVCRLLGHRWQLVASGSPPRVGHMLMCETCTDLPNTDDLDRFLPGSRDRRDLAAVAAELDACWQVACFSVRTDRESARD